eukprot:1211037-Rhodomonas_salina.1
MLTSRSRRDYYTETGIQKCRLLACHAGPSPLQTHTPRPSSQNKDPNLAAPVFNSRNAGQARADTSVNSASAGQNQKKSGCTGAREKADADATAAARRIERSMGEVLCFRMVGVGLMASPFIHHNEIEDLTHWSANYGANPRVMDRPG